MASKDVDGEPRAMPAGPAGSLVSDPVRGVNAAPGPRDGHPAPPWSVPSGVTALIPTRRIRY